MNNLPFVFHNIKRYKPGDRFPNSFPTSVKISTIQNMYPYIILYLGTSLPIEEDSWVGT